MASGDPQNTARKPSGKKAGKLSQKEQSERFKQTARELEADETGEAFERALRRVGIKPAKDPSRSDEP
ncbi:MAG: hypothetical protein E5W28_01560 [Mesorhizobium sp.]|nr:MAG: hypothetical protein EOS63_17200 [Mesorhizobium sp.]TIT07198.1 MAG: hypothetical protein E5W74_27180 [Mesorhizobium sp.]TIU42086.1 MAG: hypothetical protein E5W28_01560 [Mesorhizobium sp.]TJW58222.1 MAG: hypothetical protein E5V97_33480 [Mesorhizobium sp.]